MKSDYFYIPFGCGFLFFHHIFNLTIKKYVDIYSWDRLCCPFSDDSSPPKHWFERNTSCVYQLAILFSCILNEQLSEIDKLTLRAYGMIYAREQKISYALHLMNSYNNPTFISNCSRLSPTINPTNKNRNKQQISIQTWLSAMMSHPFHHLT